MSQFSQRRTLRAGDSPPYAAANRNSRSHHFSQSPNHSKQSVMGVRERTLEFGHFVSARLANSRVSKNVLSDTTGNNGLRFALQLLVSIQNLLKTGGKQNDYETFMHFCSFESPQSLIRSIARRCNLRDDGAHAYGKYDSSRIGAGNLTVHARVIGEEPGTPGILVCSSQPR